MGRKGMKGFLKGVHKKHDSDDEAEAGQADHTNTSAAAGKPSEHPKPAPAAAPSTAPELPPQGGDSGSDGSEDEGGSKGPETRAKVLQRHKRVGVSVSQLSSLWPTLRPPGPFGCPPGFPSPTSTLPWDPAATGKGSCTGLPLYRSNGTCVLGVTVSSLPAPRGVKGAHFHWRLWPPCTTRTPAQHATFARHTPLPQELLAHKKVVQKLGAKKKVCCLGGALC